MAVKKGSKLYKEYQEAYKKYEKKLDKFQMKDADVSLEDFGFDRRNFKYSKNMSAKELKQVIKNLDDFNSRKYYMKKIGTKEEYGKEVPVYMSNVQYNYAVKNINELNDRRLKLKKAIKTVGSTYAYLNSKTGKVEHYTRSPRELDQYFDDNPDFDTTAFQIHGGKLIGSKHGKVKKYGISAESFKERYSKHYKGLKGERYKTLAEMNEQLKNNFMKGVKNKTSPYFAKILKDLMKEEKIDTNDFLGLFYTSGVFDFDFIYNIPSKKDLRASLKSEIENFRSNPKYKQFRKMLSEE